jgi:acetyl esterase/lipase
MDQLFAYYERAKKSIIKPYISHRITTMRTTLIPMLTMLILSSPIFAAEPKAFLNIPYTDTKNEKQTLDLFAPPDAKNLPIIFWIHGGGWQAGNKEDVQIKPQAFTAKGFIFVSTNYRLIPAASIKEMAGDIAKSMRWVFDHAKEYGGDPSTFLVMGHSAGAQLAALLSTDDSYLKAEKLPLTIIKGCVPVDGDTYDVPMQIAMVIERSAISYRKKFGDEKQQKELSPVTHVAKGKNIPPFLILHVAGHPETGGQSQRLVKELRAAGISASAYPSEGKTHGSINADLGKVEDKPTIELYSFLEKVLKK